VEPEAAAMQEVRLQREEQERLILAEAAVPQNPTIPQMAVQEVLALSSSGRN